MSIYIKGIDKPSNCLECPFLSKFEEFQIRNIDEHPNAYIKIAHCMLCPEETEDPWRNTEWLLNHTESWCPIEQKDWIPVSERLPNRNGCYNVTRIIEGTAISDVCYFDGQNTWHRDVCVNHGRPYLDDIIAWQPLSEPYKEGGTE